MLETIIDIDTVVFYFINKELESGFTNTIMPIVTQLLFWLPLLGIFSAYQIFKGGWYGRLCVIGIVVGIMISDPFSSMFLKEIVLRPRPCHIFTDINLLVGCGSGLSFPSSHSVNSMMGIMLIFLFFRKYKIVFLIPFLIGISRIFVGVHYPADVLCGWIIGIVVAFFSYTIVRLVTERVLSKRFAVFSELQIRPIFQQKT